MKITAQARKDKGMKSVGILTLYRVRNLGACLQAMATKRVIEEQGNEAIFIRAYGIKMSWNLFRGDMGKIRPWNIPFLIEKDLKFRSFFKQYKEITLDKINDVDGVVVGSDSIWISGYGNCTIPDCFFGNVNCDNIRAYAPSVGGSYDLRNYKKINLSYLDRIKTITVRDELTKKFVQDCTGQCAKIVLDPTLLVNWNDIAKKHTPKERKKYIAIYGPVPLDILSEIKRFSLEKECKLINLGAFNRRLRDNRAVDPYEFIGYISGAEYVFTSMFHGVLICLSLNKEFKYMPIMKNRTEKLQSVFKKMELGEDIIYDNCLDNQGTFVWKNALDYTNINNILKIERRRTKEMFKEWFG